MGLEYKNTKLVMTRYGDFTLLYDLKYFPDREEARKHFNDHWHEDDQKMARELEASGAASPEEFLKGGGAIRYKQFADDDRWHLFMRFEVFDFTRFQPGVMAPSEDETLVTCPECGRTAYPLHPLYIHKVYSGDGRAFAQEKCMQREV